VDLTRPHPRPCQQYDIHRCLGPCVPRLTTNERYAEAAHDVRLFLDGRRHDLVKSLEQRMETAAEKELYEQAAAYRDLLRTLEDEYLPKAIHVPEEFEDREVLEELLTERAAHKVEIFTPQRGSKKAILDLVKSNAEHSFTQRFRVLKPNSKAIAEALQNALNLPEEPTRIESFDISHMQGTDTVASMVVWEKGRMKKSDY